MPARRWRDGLTSVDLFLEISLVLWNRQLSGFASPIEKPIPSPGGTFHRPGTIGFGLGGVIAGHIAIPVRIHRLTTAAIEFLVQDLLDIIAELTFGKLSAKENLTHSLSSRHQIGAHSDYQKPQQEQNEKDFCLIHGDRKLFYRAFQGKTKIFHRE
jgi:hypothetical protein